ncbi:MAG: nucleotidyltransferase domain-containing protein [Sulfuricurvum sp.]
MKNRLYGQTKNLSSEELIRGFVSLPYVKTAFLFGSRASGRAHSKSDYDFALDMESLPEETWGMQAKAWMDVCDVLGLREYDIDVVDLARADALIKHSVAENYILLKGDENDVSRLLG